MTAESKTQVARLSGAYEWALNVQGSAVGQSIRTLHEIGEFYTKKRLEDPTSVPYQALYGTDSDKGMLLEFCREKNRVVDPFMMDPLNLNAAWNNRYDKKSALVPNARPIDILNATPGMVVYDEYGMQKPGTVDIQTVDHTPRIMMSFPPNISREIVEPYPKNLPGWMQKPQRFFGIIPDAWDAAKHMVQVLQEERGEWQASQHDPSIEALLEEYSKENIKAHGDIMKKIYEYLHAKVNENDSMNIYLTALLGEPFHVSYGLKGLEQEHTEYIDTLLQQLPIAPIRYLDQDTKRIILQADETNYYVLKRDFMHLFLAGYKGERELRQKFLEYIIGVQEEAQFGVVKPTNKNSLQYILTYMSTKR